MNIFFLTIIILILIYFFLNWFAVSSSKKLSNLFRKIIIYGSIILAILNKFVEPAFPKGTPAVITTVSPGNAK